MTFVVTVTPKPIAAPGAWLAEWRVIGPFPTRTEAAVRAAQLRDELSKAAGIGSAWHVRVSPLEAPARGGC